MKDTYNQIYEEYKNSEFKEHYHTIESVIRGVRDNKHFIFRASKVWIAILIFAILNAIFLTWLIVWFVIFTDDPLYMWLFGSIPIAGLLMLFPLLIYYILTTDAHVVIGPEGILIDKVRRDFYSWTSDKFTILEAKLKSQASSPFLKRLFVTLKKGESTFTVLRLSSVASEEMMIQDIDKRLLFSVQPAIIAHICFLYHDKATEHVPPGTEFVSRHFSAPDIYEHKLKEYISGNTFECKVNISAKFDKSSIAVALIVPKLGAIIQNVDKIHYQKAYDSEL